HPVRERTARRRPRCRDRSQQGVLAHLGNGGAFGWRCLDPRAQRRPAVATRARFGHQARNRLAEAGDQHVIVGFDGGDETGQVRLGLGEGSGFHVRTYLTWSTTALFWLALTML